MALSDSVVNQFAKLVNSGEKQDNGVTVKGTYQNIGGVDYVRIDGSDILTPVTALVEAETGERVTVEIKDHEATLTGNISSPMARSKSVSDLKDEVDEHGNTIKQMDNTITQQGNSIIQINNSINQQNTVINQHETKINQYGDEIVSINNKIVQQGNQLELIDNNISMQGDKIDSMNNTITQHGNTINSMNNTIQQHGNNITQISNTIEQQGNVITQQGNIITQQGNIIEEQNTRIQTNSSNITILNSGFVIKDGVLTGLSKIILDVLETDLLKTGYAAIDFANIGMAAVEKLFNESGIIKDLVVGDQHITGELVGVTIKGDLIEAGTLIADKLVVLGEDGLYYKLNMTGESIAAEQTEYNSLNGSIITAKSITAEKINVKDLVAFGATIGGFTIGQSSIHTNTKSSIDSNINGLYLGKDGQVYLGDPDNHVKYYKDENDNWKLDIQASDLHIGTSGKTINEELKDIRDNTTIYLQIESSKGLVFKNDQVSTLLSVTIYRGSDRITDIETLKSKMGPSVYLQWSWKRLDEDEYGIISSSDKRIGNNGFTFTLNPDDVETKVTFLCELIV